MSVDPSSAGLLLAAHQLVADYARFLDARDSRAFASLFISDGAIQIGPDRRIQGHRALGAFVLRAPRGVHVPGVPSVSSDQGGRVGGDGDEVRARSAMIFLDSDTGLSRAVVNDDVLTWVHGHLLIAERRIDIRASSGER